jgi:hypothetical protein
MCVSNDGHGARPCNSRVASTLWVAELPHKRRTTKYNLNYSVPYTAGFHHGGGVPTAVRNAGRWTAAIMDKSRDLGA